jgi:hypothetical protein
MKSYHKYLKDKSADFVVIPPHEIIRDSAVADRKYILIAVSESSWLVHLGPVSLIYLRTPHGRMDRRVFVVDGSVTYVQQYLPFIPYLICDHRSFLVGHMTMSLAE